MLIECVCGDFHDIAPTGMVLVIGAFQRGELSTTKGRTVCMMESFTNENIGNIRHRYPKGTLFGVRKRE